MLRLITFLEEAAGVELVLPVTPSSYEWPHEAAIETVTVDQLGDLNFFGGKRMGSTTLHDYDLLPAQAYRFCRRGRAPTPWLYLEQLERWVDKGDGGALDGQRHAGQRGVLLEGVTYREQDGTNDLYADITLRQYTRPETPVLPAEPPASSAGTAASRDSATGTSTTKTCTVASGETLWGISRKFYGDGSLAWRLAAANGIANANLIRPGQVLAIPPLDQLPAAAAKPASAQVAAATEVREVKEEASGTARLVPWVPENTVKSLADLELDKIASGGGLWQSTRW
ncbi:MAG: LysM peptidoglycan-binding domain-containing protein [Flavonifractor plautii]